MRPHKISSLKRDADCQRCGLCKTAEHVCLLGKGPKPCKVMIVGEAPGHREDDSGKPFVGRSGELLEELLEVCDIDRSDVYITNAVHCRPPDNRTPKKKEIEACKHWLLKEIEAVKPKFVLLMGNIPLYALLGQKGIRKARGMPVEKDGVIYFPTYHPSYALRMPKQRPVLRSDMLMFFKIVDRGGIGDEEGLNYHIIKSWKDVNRAFEDIERTSIVSVDTETSGLDQFTPDFAIQSIHVGTMKHQWCFPLSHPGGWLSKKPMVRERLMAKLIHLLKRRTVVMQNGKYDTIAIAEEYGEVLYCDFDTMLAHYNVDENTVHDLKFLAQHYFDSVDYDIPLAEKQGKLAPEIVADPKLSEYFLERHCKYAALDVFYTRKLYFKLKKLLQEDDATYKLFTELTMPVARMYVDIERNGVYIDRKQLKKARDHYKKQAQDALAKLNRLCPDDRVWKNKKTGLWQKGINWGSPKQVGEVLFKRLKLPSLEKTGKGADSTSESVLLRLAKQHKVPKLILEWREATKNLGTFLDAWERMAVANKLHPTFKIHGTVTGRPSCEEPNLQQVPRNPMLRACISAPPGWTLVEIDQSQVELRVAAEYSRDPALVMAYQTGQDIHTKTVRDVLGIMNPTDEERKKGKAINFGLLYGMWWPKFIIYARDNYDQVFTEREAQEVHANFFRTYAGLGPWHKRQKRFANQNGYVRNLIGRMRRLPAAMARDDSSDCKEAQRQAINSPVQSLASDITLAGALAIHKYFSRSIVRICGTVHDAVLMWVRTTHLKRVIKKARQLMEHPPLIERTFNCRMSIPLIAEAKIGAWGVGKKIKEKS